MYRQRQPNKTVICRRAAKAVIVTGMMFSLLAGCQGGPVSPPVQTAGLPAPSPSVAPVQPPPTNSETVQDNEDIVANLIESIETEEKEQTQILPAPAAEIATASTGRAPQIETEQNDRKKLAEQALNAALSLLKAKQPKAASPAGPYQLEDKSSGQLRIGLLLPFSGDYSSLGRDIASGAEMALFQMGDHQIELLYFDTQASGRAEQAAREAVAAQTDIVIGPLFTQSAAQARTILGGAGIAMLSLSNNSQAAAPGQWVLGYLPEQQIDYLLGHAMAQNKTRIAVLAAEDAFGQRLSAHAVMRLSTLGLSPAEVMILPPERLADEDSLKQAIKSFSRYSSVPDENAPLPAPAYDALILAGGPDFILRVAPVLAFYDMDPDRVTYLGTDLWARAELLAEPSLQGALVTQATQPASDEFETRYQGLFQKPSNNMARMGFDAFALIAVTKQTRSAAAGSAEDDSLFIDWRASLIRQEGFTGLSGRFNLLPDGKNQRFYEIRQIRDRQLIAH